MHYPAKQSCLEQALPRPQEAPLPPTATPLLKRDGILIEAKVTFMGPETGRRRPGRREVGKVWQPVGRTEQWWEGNWECPGKGPRRPLGCQGAKCGGGSEVMQDGHGVGWSPTPPVSGEADESHTLPEW